MKNYKNRAFALSILIALLTVAGCSDDVGMTRQITDYEKHCTQDTVDSRARFILDCIENANPKSDEEPEDWITDCRHMAEETYCPIKKVVREEECTSANEFGRCHWYMARTLSEKYSDS